MKHPWLAYAIVVVLAIAVGVAVAGIPDRTSDGAIVSPSTIASTVATTEAPTASTEPASTSAPATTEPEPTAPSTPETSRPDASTPSTEPAATEPASTVPGTTAPLPDRDQIIVVAANGTGLAGSAGRMVDQLEELGYLDSRPRNGTDVSDFTVIYYVDGFEDAARRMGDDLELFPDFVAPLDDAPEVLDLPSDVQLLAYVGLDRA